MERRLRAGVFIFGNDRHQTEHVFFVMKDGQVYRNNR